MQSLIVELANSGGRIRVDCREGNFRILPIAPLERDEYRLSRHAYLRMEAGDAVLDAAVARARLAGAPEIIAGIFHTGEPLELLAAAGLAVCQDEDPRWEFHDLIYQQQSTRSDPLRRYGATWRFKDRLAPPASVEIDFQGEPIALQRHEPGNEAFANVVDRRCSAERCGSSPLQLGELGAFLSLALRRLPSAGGLRELAFYILAARCTGLEAGAFRYDADRHHLQRVRGGEAAAHKMLARAGSYWGCGEATPDALIVAAAAIPIQAWKYEGMAYRNALLDTGCALQSMYLAATSLGLGGCALGWNEPALLSAITGVSPLAECSMAAFVLNGG